MWGRDREKKVISDETKVTIDVTKTVSEGDLDQLKIILENEPGVVTRTFKWNGGRFSGNVLHMAASYNQPEIARFLVTRKGVDINGLSENNWTPLHHAVSADAPQAVKALLSLGADPALKNSEGTIPFDLCEGNTAAKEVLRLYNEETLEREAEERLEGTWTSGPPDKITHEYEQPGHRFFSSRKLFETAAKALDPDYQGI